LSPAQPSWLDAAIEKALAARTADADGANASAGSPAPRVTPDKATADAPAQQQRGLAERSTFLRGTPTMQRWDVGMRQALSVDVSKLPPQCLNDVVKIVLKRQPENGAEVTIDFNTISEPVCDELRAFVEKSRAESTAKATLASCADGGPCPWIKKDAPPPPPEAPPRPYLLYAAVAVAAVAAVVVMRRRR
jgi:MYXO-CTERM domain-containing protein